MKLSKARQLKVGDLVHYPADRGDKEGSGRVTHISPVECSHPLLSEPHLQVEVQMPGNRKTVWPSNRLG